MRATATFRMRDSTTVDPSSSMTARIRSQPRESQRSAAAALSSGRVSKAIAARGAWR